MRTAGRKGMQGVGEGAQGRAGAVKREMEEMPVPVATPLRWLTSISQ